MNVLDCFSGVGGGILASYLLGHNVVCAIEENRFCQQLLVSLQDSRAHYPFSIWSDIRTFKGQPWVGCINLVQGGFPCQNISSAGDRSGLDGKESSLFWELWRVFCECQAEYLFIENSPMLRFRGLDQILEVFAEERLDAE